MAAASSTSAVVAPLLAALKRDNDDLAEHPEAYLEAVAQQLSEAVGHAPKRARSLAFNLPRNPELRRALLSGSVSAQSLCDMDLADLASESVKRQRREQADRVQATIRRAAAGHLGALTRAVRCPECKHREARFIHEGTDCAEWHGRKNEVWGTKHDDDESAGLVTLTCTACNHSWQSGEAPLPCKEPEPQVQRKGILGWKGSLRE